MKGSSTSFLSSGLVISLILAYFVYETIEGVLAIGLLYLTINLIHILSIIPLVGWIASILINWYILIPMILSLTGIEMTWLVGLIFAYSCFGGFILTAMVIIALIALVLDS